MTNQPTPTGIRVIDEALSIEQVLTDLRERGVNVSERSLREQARRMGCYRKIGRTMFFLPEDLERLMTPAPKAKQPLGKRIIQQAAKAARAPLPKPAASKPRPTPAYPLVPYTRDMTPVDEQEDKT